MNFNSTIQEERGIKRARDWNEPEAEKEGHDERIRDLLWQSYQFNKFSCFAEANQLYQRAKRLDPTHPSVINFGNLHS